MTKVRVNISFVSKKQISFTTRIDIEDDYDNSYSIYCSGTADNCLLSNWFFMLRMGSEFTISAENEK